MPTARLWGIQGDKHQGTGGGDGGLPDVSHLGPGSPPPSGSSRDARGDKNREQAHMQSAPEQARPKKETTTTPAEAKGLWAEDILSREKRDEIREGKEDKRGETKGRKKLRVRGWGVLEYD